MSCKIMFKINGVSCMGFEGGIVLKKIKIAHCVGRAGTILIGLQLQSILTIMQRRFCPAACPTRAPMLALLRLLFLFGLNLHRHPILIWERARMKPETCQLGVAQRMKLLSSNWNQLKTLRKVTLDRRRTNLGVKCSITRRFFDQPT